VTAKLPVGEAVADTSPAGRPREIDYHGQRVALSPLRAELVPARVATLVEELYSGSHGDPATESLWTYMAYGPFADRAAMRAWLDGCAASSDPLFLVVRDKLSQKAVGMVTFMAIRPEMRCLELGHIWYVPQAQGTGINTEAVFLMLREAFDQGYRRVEWKCDGLNERSRRAALRLGFTFEGVFRQHMIVKGRNRDTAWFAMLDHEWPSVRTRLEDSIAERGGGTRR
jgi:RimJ/RimL family protein N-acetyltransferase